MLERKFQKEVIDSVKQRFPGSMVLKNDANYIQGIPDLLILFRDKWAALECKQNGKASHQPNQDYYIELMENMSFARVIYPENKEEVLDELSRSFGS